MKKIKMIALSMLLLSACTKDNNENGPGTTSDDLTATGSKAVNTRIFEITLTSTADTDSPNPPTSCSGDFQGFAIGDLSLHGNASQMGLIDAELSTLHHVNCNVSFATALLTTGISGQIVGANGDLIYYTGEDVINVANLLTNGPPTGSITGVWTITGGTGRFAGATGSVNINGTVDFVTSTFSGTGLGTLTY